MFFIRHFFKNWLSFLRINKQFYFRKGGNKQCYQNNAQIWLADIKIYDISAIPEAPFWMVDVYFTKKEKIHSDIPKRWQTFGQEACLIVVLILFIF